MTVQYLGQLGSLKRRSAFSNKLSTNAIHLAHALQTQEDCESAGLKGSSAASDMNEHHQAKREKAVCFPRLANFQAHLECGKEGVKIARSST